MFTSFVLSNSSKMFSMWLVLYLSVTSYSMYGVYGTCTCTESEHKQSSIYRPCDVTDWDCIRGFFAEHSNCTPSHGPVPDPLVASYTELPLSHANMTFIKDQSETKGLSKGVIKELYVNKKTGNLVLEVVFKKLTLNTTAAILRYHLKGREYVDLKDSLYLAVRQFSITLVVPYVNGIKLSEGKVFSYIGDPNITLKLGPGLYSQDPELSSSLTKLLSTMHTTVREGYTTVGPVYLSAFIQNKLCQF